MRKAVSVSSSVAFSLEMIMDVQQELGTTHLTHAFELVKTAPGQITTQLDLIISRWPAAMDRYAE